MLILHIELWLLKNGKEWLHNMDKRVYGLDLPNEITRENEKITKEMFGITDDDINSIEIDDDEQDN